MDFKTVEKIADAVLYEGYILYPYRASAVKNRQRFNFGALMPEAYSVAERGTERWRVQTESLVLAGEQTRLSVKGRFLHLVAREIYQIADSQLRPVEALEVEGRLFQTWQEAVEREAKMSGVSVEELLRQPLRSTFAFPATRKDEPLRDANGTDVGLISRRQEAVEGAIELRLDELQKQGENRKLFKLTASIFNTTAFEHAAQKSRDEALMCALASAHTILGVEGGEFVSLLETPDEFKEAAGACKNSGTYPVLAGDAGVRDVMLSSPIILYDYPQIAPESDGDLFDGTEIDEILLLRIMTLTDEEKREMRSVDERARQILERVETLPPEQLMKLHGTLRGLR
jgi:hypothetical protein